MKATTLGLILIVIGTIGGIIAYASCMYYQDYNFAVMGLVANGIQVLGLGVTHIK